MTKALYPMSTPPMPTPRMSTPPMSTPRRPRRWPIFLPFGALVVLAALWTGFWFFASAKAETTLAGWREREAKSGRIYSCEKQTVGGFPFRIEVRCVDPAAELRGEPPVALRAKDLLSAVQVYDPHLVISEIQSPLTIGEPGKPPAYIANWKLGQSSVRGTPEAPERVSFVFEAPTVDRVADGRNISVFNAERAELHGRLAAGSVVDHPVIDLALLLQGASAPELHPMAATPADTDIVAVLRGLKDFAPKPWPDRFREIQAANGQIEIVKARVQQDDVIAVGAGKLGLSPNGGLNGSIQVTIVNLDKVLKKFDIDKIMSEGQIASTFGALDKIMPGLGNLARQNAPSLIASIGQRTVLEGKPAVVLPLRFVDGNVYLGPIQVGRAPPLF
jgi:hypothetical protein